MFYSQYLRLESKAGGVASSNRAFIKACHSVITKQGKEHVNRDARHAWIKSGLEYKQDALKLYVSLRPYG